MLRPIITGRGQRGVTAVEYGMLLALIVGVIFAVVVRLGDNTRVLYCEMAQDVAVAGGAPSYHFSPALLSEGCTPAVQPISFPATVVRFSGEFGNNGIIDGDFGDLEDPIGEIFDVAGTTDYSPAGVQSFVQYYGQTGGGSPWAAVSATPATTAALESACATSSVPFPTSNVSFAGPPLGVAETTTIASTGAAELQTLGDDPSEYTGGYIPPFNPTESVVT
jgi:Flp pilus assembly pilin Flp